MLESIFSSRSINITIGQILICSLCALIYGCIISLAHRQTSRSGKNFLTTIAILPFLVQIIILLVNGNLGASVAVAGTFGLVRFRSMPGTSKEILTVFFAMTVGLACGIGSVGLGGAVTVLGSIMMILLYYVKLFDRKGNEKILSITIPEDLNYTNCFDSEFREYTDKVLLERVKTSNMGSLFELRYRVNLKKGIDEKAFIDEIRVKNGNLKVMLAEDLENNEL